MRLNLAAELRLGGKNRLRASDYSATSHNAFSVRVRDVLLPTLENPNKIKRNRI